MGSARLRLADVGDAGRNDFTATEKLACAERELRLRKQVYPRRIEAGRMSKRAADHEIAVLYAIIQDYREQARKERLL